MKQALRKAESQTWHIDAGDNRVEGVHSGIRGDVSGISGNVTGIRGNVTGISGYVDECEITDDERVAGVNINRLVEKGGGE